MTGGEGGHDGERRVSFRGRLEWSTLLAYFAGRAIPGVERVTADAYRRTILTAGEPGVLTVRRGGAGHLLVETLPADGDAAVHVEDRVRRLFGLDVDIEAANAWLAADAVLGALVSARPGLRPPGAWDPFEIGIRAIVGQQVSVAGASTLAGRIVRRHGPPVAMTNAPELTHTFPPPERLAGADLDGLGLTGGRIRAIHAFAAAVAEGDVRLDGGTALDELVASLVAVPGLGPWTANYLALRLGHPDAFPAADLGLQRAMARPDRPSAAALQARAEAWRPWRAVAATHLWVQSSVRDASLSDAVGTQAPIRTERGQTRSRDSTSPTVGLRAER